MLPYTDNIDVLLDEAISRLISTIESGKDILITKSSKYCVNKKRKRKGWNPETGEDRMSGARKVVTFKCSVRLRG